MVKGFMLATQLGEGYGELLNSPSLRFRRN